VSPNPYISSDRTRVPPNCVPTAPCSPRSVDMPACMGSVKLWFTSKLGIVIPVRRKHREPPGETDPAAGEPSALAPVAPEKPEGNVVPDPPAQPTKFTQPTQPAYPDNPQPVGHQHQVSTPDVPAIISPSTTPYNLIPPVKTLPLTTEDILSQCPRYAFSD